RRVRRGTHRRPARVGRFREPARRRLAPATPRGRRQLPADGVALPGARRVRVRIPAAGCDRHRLRSRHAGVSLAAVRPAPRRAALAPRAHAFRPCGPRAGAAVSGRSGGGDARGRGPRRRGEHGRVQEPGPRGRMSATTPAELELIDAYWRAANYLSVGQIYLLDNALLREPLEPKHVKPRLLGHWGTTPGINFVYAHLNRVIRNWDLNAMCVIGPGHGGPAAVANAYLEGTYSEVYPH